MALNIVRQTISLEGRGARGEGFAAAARRVGSLGGVTVPPTATDAEVLALATGSELEGSDLFEARPTTNLHDPDATDPLLATTADQLHRVWNPAGASGSLAAANIATLPQYGVTRRIDVSSIAVGDPIWISAHGAPVGMNFHFSGAPFIGWYDSTHTYEGVILAADFARETGDRALNIPLGRPAADYHYIALNIADTNANADSPLGEARLQAFLDAIVVNGGSDYAEFTPFTAAGQYDLATEKVEAALETVGAVTVLLQAGYAFIRTAAQASTTHDLAEMVHYDQDAADYVLQTGVVDFVGRRAILKTTTAAATIAAYNQADILVNGQDEGAPVRINGTYLGAGHRVPGYETVIAAHGLGNANIGAVALDGAGKAWVLAIVVDADTAAWLPDNTTTADKWTMAGAMTGATLTWSSGGADFGTLNITGTPTAVQIPPVMRDHEKRLLLDGEVITADGVYSGEDFRIEESYGISNLASIVTYLKGRVGALTAPDFADASIAVQVELSHTYVWDRYGARVKYSTHHAKQAYRRDAWGTPGDYFGEVQVQRPSRTIDTPPGTATAVDLYVPNLTGAVGGYDFTARADVTANASWVTVPKSAAADTADPPSHMAYIARDGSGDIHGFAFGAVRDVGLGKPATRAASVNNLLGLSSAEKGYLVLADNALGDAAAGDVYDSATFVAHWLVDDAELTIPGVLVPNSTGGYECLIAAHQTLSRKWVPLHPDMVGRLVTVRESHANVTVHSEVVTKHGVMISVASGYGDVVLTLAAR